MGCYKVCCGIVRVFLFHVFWLACFVGAVACRFVKAMLCVIDSMVYDGLHFACGCGLMGAQVLLVI